MTAFHAGRFSKREARAFTLIEIMIVVGIMGLAVAISVPIVYKVTHKSPFYAAITDLVEVCSNARAQAILQNRITEVVFFPQEGRVELRGAGGSPAFPKRASAAGLKISGTSAIISNRVNVDMLDINLIEYRDKETALVRFYPNGTCDEMTVVLRSEDGEQRGIVLEVTTGLASVLSIADLQRLRSGSL
jgi:prepilin-type N-terminal cleavage/methylation domain-containing protein